MARVIAKILAEAIAAILEMKERKKQNFQNCKKSYLPIDKICLSVNIPK